MPAKLARTAAALLTAAFSVLGGIKTPVSAHEGHDHGAPPPPVSTTIAPRADASSADFELVLIARGDAVTAFLDSFKGNEPIENAEIEVDAPQGQIRLAPDGSGGYSGTAPFLAKPGSYELAITIAAAGTVDVLTASLKIPEPDPVRETSGSVASWLVDSAIANDLRRRAGTSDVSLIAAALAGFAAGIAVMLLFRRRRTASAVALLGCFVLAAAPSDVSADPATMTPAARDVAQRLADGAVFVPKPTQRILGIRTTFTVDAAHRRALELPGRIVPDPNASGLVQAAVGGRLSPPPGGFKTLGSAVKAGDILALVQPPVPSADLTAQQQQARELDQQISIVSRKIERLKAVEQVIARGQLEDAELELAGLRERRANLDRVGRQPEPLVSPVDGIIAASNAVAGQMAEPNSVIYQIIDPARFLVEALSFDPHAIDGRAQGLFAGGRSLELGYIGTGIADRNQAVPVHFAIRGEAPGLRAGQFLTVLASTAEERRGLALPRQAVLRGANGQNIVFEHTNAERFVIREVRIEPLDGERVLIVAGIEAGRRIVTEGAELLNQIR